MILTVAALGYSIACYIYLLIYYIVHRHRTFHRILHLTADHCNISGYDIDGGGTYFKVGLNTVSLTSVSYIFLSADACDSTIPGGDRYMYIASPGLLATPWGNNLIPSLRRYRGFYTHDSSTMYSSI